jgi:hypothetical protein
MGGERGGGKEGRKPTQGNRERKKGKEEKKECFF